MSNNPKPVPLLDAKPVQEQPQYPQKNLQITPQGLLIQDIMSPFFVVTTIVPAQNMDEVVRAWREFRKNQSDMQLAIQRSRND